MAVASPKSWSTLITDINALDVLRQHGDSGLDHGRYGKIMPILFDIAIGSTPPDILGKSYENGIVTIDPEAANLRHYDGDEFGPGVLFLLQHRKGGARQPEDFYRVLRVDGMTTENDERHPDNPEAEFRIGEHPEHAGQFGVNLGARHVGNLSLGGDVMLVVPDNEIVFKYFPIGPAAQAGRGTV